MMPPSKKDLHNKNNISEELCRKQDGVKAWKGEEEEDEEESTAASTTTDEDFETAHLSVSHRYDSPRSVVATWSSHNFASAKRNNKTMTMSDNLSAAAAAGITSNAAASTRPAGGGAATSTDGAAGDGGTDRSPIVTCVGT